MIGIIADTHDNVENILKAVEVFKKNKVDFVIHLGDIVAPASVMFFKGVKVKFIKGNCDGDLEKISMKAKEIGSEFVGNILELEIEGKKIAAIHGDHPIMLGKLIQSGKYDFVLYGHTHQSKDEMVGKTRVINPGAHYWHSEGTIVLLDVASDKIEFVKLSI